MIKKNQLMNAICLGIAITLSSFALPKQSNAIAINTEPSISTNKDNSIDEKEITLSFVGDCTIGTDPNFGYSRSFTELFDKNNKDYSYFFKGVKSILESDDLTIANLETTFTNATKKKVKQFNFKGDPSYVNILLNGSVEIVNLANNHTYDYLEKGYTDTVDALDNANVDYYGNNTYLITEVKGIRIGFVGLTGFDSIQSTYLQIDKATKYFNDNNVDIKVISFHWGIERENYFNSKQQILGRYAIDKGFNLVVGHHPHVLQGIEEYKDAYIVYSLGNFVFGGNKNPYDKDSMIFQQTFYFENDKLVNDLVKIIPVSISSKTTQNDYQPTILEGENKVKVLTRINKYSKNFVYDID